MYRQVEIDLADPRKPNPKLAWESWNPTSVIPCCPQKTQRWLNKENGVGWGSCWEAVGSLEPLFYFMRLGNYLLLSHPFRSLMVSFLKRVKTLDNQLRVSILSKTEGFSDHMLTEFRDPRSYSPQTYTMQAGGQKILPWGIWLAAEERAEDTDLGTLW